MFSSADNDTLYKGQQASVSGNGLFFWLNFSIKHQIKALLLLVVLRDFGRREAEKLVTHRENNGSDNFFCIGGVGSVNMHQLDQSPSAHPRVYLTLDERIKPKVRKFKND